MSFSRFSTSCHQEEEEKNFHLIVKETFLEYVPDRCRMHSRNGVHPSKCLAIFVKLHRLIYVIRIAWSDIFVRFKRSFSDSHMPSVAAMLHFKVLSFVRVVFQLKQHFESFLTKTCHQMQGRRSKSSYDPHQEWATKAGMHSRKHSLEEPWQKKGEHFRLQREGTQIDC